MSSPNGAGADPQDVILAQAARIERLEARVRELHESQGGARSSAEADAWGAMRDRLREVYTHLEAGRTWQAWLLVAAAIDLADDMYRLTHRDGGGESGPDETGRGG